jgi:hypothetical protein
VFLSSFFNLLVHNPPPPHNAIVIELQQNAGAGPMVDTLLSSWDSVIKKSLKNRRTAESFFATLDPIGIGIRIRLDNLQLIFWSFNNMQVLTS